MEFLATQNWITIRIKFCFARGSITSNFTNMGRQKGRTYSDYTMQIIGEAWSVNGDRDRDTFNKDKCIEFGGLASHHKSKYSWQMVCSRRSALLRTHLMPTVVPPYKELGCVWHHTLLCSLLQSLGGEYIAQLNRFTYIIMSCKFFKPESWIVWKRLNVCHTEDKMYKCK